jgi:ferredoxin-NADP reductase
MEKYTLTLKSTQDVADGTKMFAFTKPEGFSFKAGQYVALEVKEFSVPDDGKGRFRSLSIASAPYEEDLQFVMRQGESSFKQTLWSLAVGDEVFVMKPVGSFVLSEEEAEQSVPVVFLIGGVGITPARSMIREAIHQGSKRKFYLFYSNRFQKDAAFHDEFCALRSENIVYVNTLTQEGSTCSALGEERGYICREIIEKYAPSIADMKSYIVGSPEFSMAMKDMLLGMGVPLGNIKMDSFTGLRSPKKTKASA